jgi:photosystem II stability/assembly factor-like uncharacterized protein
METTTSSFFQKNKKLVIALAIIIPLIIALILGGFLLTRKKDRRELESSNAKSDLLAKDSIGNSPNDSVVNENSGSSDGYPESLPNNTCPDKKEVVGGQAKLYLNGKEVMVSGDGMKWIDQNCKSLNAANPDAYNLDCKPRTHEYYRTQQAFAIDPKNSQVMFMAVEYKGVFKSTDGGQTWKKTVNGITAYPKKDNPSEKCYQEFGKIVIDPNNSNHVLVSRVESPGLITDKFSENAGVWESVDGGNNWKQLVSGTMNASGSKGIAIDPRDSKTMYYGINNMIASWGPPDSTKFYNSKGVVYKTTDGGKTWTELGTEIQKNLRVIDMELDPKNPDVIYIGNFHTSPGEGADLDVDQSKSFQVSKDGGKSWENLASKLPTGFQAVYDISISPSTSNNIFVISQPTKSSVSGKSFFSTNSGETFTESNTNIFIAEYDPFDTTGKTLLGYSPFSGAKDIFTSTDAGKTWQAIATSGAGEKNENRLTHITFDTKTKNLVYANGNNGSLLRSKDGGKSWTKLTDYQQIEK